MAFCLLGGEATRYSDSLRQSSLRCGTRLVGTVAKVAITFVMVGLFGVALLV